MSVQAAYESVTLGLAWCPGCGVHSPWVPCNLHRTGPNPAAQPWNPSPWSPRRMTFASKCPNCGQLVPLNDDQLLRARKSTAEQTALSAAGYIETRLYAVHRCPSSAPAGAPNPPPGPLTQWEISADTALFFTGAA